MKAIKLTIVAAALCLYANAASAAYTTEYLGHRYELIVPESGIAWSQAKAAAESLKGHLATVTSAGEDKAIRDLMKSADWSAAMIGGYYANGWKWVTGEAWEEKDGFNPTLQLDVPNGQPDSVVFARYSGLWGGMASWQIGSAYIVEWEPAAVVPEPATTIAGGLLLLPLAVSAVRRLRK